jgi:sterol desaturase/sphingolipid hydroxylase (fatty acid hydroxylase superfamily)
VQPLVISIPVFVIFGGQDRTAISIYIVVATGFLLFTHTNLRLSLGPLTPVVCGPQVHRIHHSRLPEHQDKNFAQMFPFIDVVFGTYWAPERGEFPPTGTQGLASDAPILRALVQPFVIWGGMIGNLGRSIRSWWTGPERPDGSRRG